MIKSKSKIPEIKDLLWDLSIYYYKNKSLRANIFSTKKGIEFLKKIHLDPIISKYQWNYESNGIRDLLKPYYIDTFLKEIINLGININKLELKQQFDIQFQELENKILLSDYFEYFIYIPTFRVIFPENVKVIDFDSDHRLKDIVEEKSPYGIDGFKDIPVSWSRNWKRLPNASFEAKFLIKKRRSTEKPYEHKWHPIMPYDAYSEYNIMYEKIRSIYEFFLCYGNKYDLEKSTFGDKFYVKLPPFSLAYKKIDTLYTYSGFPPPRNYLGLNLPKNSKYYIDWNKRWNDNYSWFYETFYKNDPIYNDTYNFRYALEVLRSLSNIGFLRVKALLLVSTLEGLLYDSKIHKKIKKQNLPDYFGSKSYPIATTFVKVSEYKGNYWQFIFQNKYPLKTPLKSFLTNGDLKNLIISSYQYRNKIAHVLDIKNFKLNPSYLRSTDMPDYKLIEQIITQNFPYFIIFLIRLILEEKINSKGKWVNFLQDLL